MSQSERSVALGVARYLMQWICGLVALGTLAFAGFLVLAADSRALLFALKRGAFLPLAVVFVISALGWFLSRPAASRSSRHAEPDE